MSVSGKTALSPSAFDWSVSPLGEPGQWPAPLRIAADLVLNTPLPMLLVWGRGMTVLFNPAYAAVAGSAYGKAPGGTVPPVMPPPLSAGADELQRAWNGEATLAPGRTLAFAGADPVGALHDLYFTPLRGADGNVEGVVCALAPAEPVLTAPQEAAGPLRILVVEDNLDAQYLVCEMLRAFGHEADGVGHPNDALAHLAQKTYDVLFTDVSLPGMSGVDLARKALADTAPGAPRPQVIFASGYGDTLLRHVEFPYLSLQKPYELDQLQKALDKAKQQVAARA
jgi:CheY-like chemotaxis protein